MTEWQRIELRPLFEKLLEEAKDWKPDRVLPRTNKLGSVVVPQLEEYTDGKFRVDRNESVGFFEAIEKFADTGLPLSLEHFTNLIHQYRDRIQPYPHYSGIKLTVPQTLSEIDELEYEDLPDNIEDEEEDDDGSSLKLM